MPAQPALEEKESPGPADGPGPGASLLPIFRPRGVAVVGASRDPEGIGYRLLDAVLRGHFPGPVYPVNPKAVEVAGLKAYASVRDVPDPVDLAVIVVPSRFVLAVVDDCAARGVGGLIVISAGFAEAGGEGRQLQDDLKRKVRENGMRMVGPNCFGLVNTHPGVSLNATFVPVAVPRGSVAMSSDSGALGLAILNAAGRLGLGISSCVSVGNRADVSSNDLLEYWEHDDDTSVVLLYLESFGNPRRFARIARRVGRVKPIVAVKGGRTRAGQRAAGSHTAALAASDVAVDALFRQTGVMRAETLQQMLNLAPALSHQPLPAGRRVGVVTNAGGPGILCSDMCEVQGLQVPELSEGTRRRLAGFLPAAAGLHNPVDMIAAAGPEEFRRTIAAVIDSGEVDALVVLYVIPKLALPPEIPAGIAAGVNAARRRVPVLACISPRGELQWLDVPGNGHIPCYSYPEEPARVLGKMAEYAEWRARPLGTAPQFADTDLWSARSLCRQALRSRGPGWLTAAENRLVLEWAGLPVAPGGVAATADEAVRLAQKLGYPVAVKLASHRLVHKTEVKGVHLDLEDDEGVRRAFAEVRARLQAEGKLDAMEGVLVQPMVEDGTEVMVGVTHDPLFGPLIAFGLGGVHVEILADVCFRVTPLTDRDASEMVRSIRGYRLFQGYRGHPAADVPVLEEILLRVSRLVEEVPEIIELDLNPIFALAPGQGCVIVDARIQVGGSAGGGPVG